jgi:5-methylcytosine-specific restriction protein A
MPFAPKRVCAACRCTKPCRCERQSDSRRGSSNSRGYGAGWQRFREWFITRHPLCADCVAGGRYTATREVHHIRKVATHPELKLVEDNCMGLCSMHHSIRTRAGE